MFKLKIAALYFLLTVLAVVVVQLAVDNGVESVSDKLNSRVSAGFEGFEKLEQLQRLSMHSAAFRLAHSELPTYLGTLDEFRSEFLSLESETYSKWPVSDDPATEAEFLKSRRRYVAEHAEFLEQLASLLADRLENEVGGQDWGEDGRERFVRQTEIQLVDCASVSMSQCFFDFTHGPLKRVLVREDDKWSGPFRPDLVVVADRLGTGWANSENPKWSDRQTFSEDYPLILQVARQGVVDDLVQMGDEKSYHFVTAMALHLGNEFVGSVMVGVEVDPQLTRQVARTLGLDVTFLIGDSQIESSVRDDDRDFSKFVGRVLGELPEEDRYKRAELRGGDSYAGAAFYYYRPSGRTVEPEHGVLVPRKIENLRVVLSVNQGDALSPLRTLKAVLPLFGLFLFAVGVALLFVLLRQYTKPFEVIEQGIHEVISGNHTHEFKIKSQEDLPRSMSESLKLMVALLTGREPLPDNDAPGQWAEKMMGDDQLGTRPTPPSSLEGERAVVAQEVEWAPASDVDGESIDAYYRRLYDEYLEARRDLNLTGEPLAYYAFVEQLAENADRLRQRYDCRSVRFHVRVAEDRLVLSPVVLA